MSGRRALLRWAVRMLRREWRQQLLVLSLVTVAVAASAFGTAFAFNATGGGDAEFGTASHRIQVNVSDPAAVPAYLDAAHRWFGQVDVIGHRRAAVPGSTKVIDIRSFESGSSFTAPLRALRQGRLPTGPTEIAATDGVLQLLGARVGQVARVDRTERAVVGEIENPAGLDDEFVLVAPGTSAPDDLSLLVRSTEDHVRTFRATDPGSGFVAARGASERTSAAVGVQGVSAVALLLVCLVAGAGFAALAHRRMRELGLLAATGATRRQIRLAMIVNGSLVGVMASAAGNAVGLLAWVAGAPSFEMAVNHRLDRMHLPWLVLALGVLLAVGCTTAAAWWPAVAIARVPVTRALAGRPPEPRSSRQPAVLALVFLVAGVLALGVGNDAAKDKTTPLLFIPGVLAVVVAVVLAAAPAIRAIASLARPLPIAMRLPIRDLGRHLSRSAAALGAIALGLGIAASVVVLAAAAEHGAGEGNLGDRQLVLWTNAPGEGLDLMARQVAPHQLERFGRTAGEIAAATGGRAVPLDVAVDPSQERRGDEVLRPAAHVARRVNEHTLRDGGLLFVATPEVLRHVGVDPSSVAADAYVVTRQRHDIYIVGTRSDFRRTPVSEGAVRRTQLPGHTSTPQSLITDAGLAASGLQSLRVGWLIEAPQPIHATAVRSARDRAAADGITLESRDPQAGLQTLEAGATAVGILLALAIVAMTVGLLHGEAASDMRTLTATGATRRTHRTLVATTAGSLAVLGAVLGITGAYASLVAGYWPQTERLGRAPLEHLTVMAVGLPVVAAGAGWLLSGRDQRTRRPYE